MNQDEAAVQLPLWSCPRCDEKSEGPRKVLEPRPSTKTSFTCPNCLEVIQ